MKKVFFIIFILSMIFCVDYNLEIQPIFNASCINCHNPQANNYSNHQLDLTSYQGLMEGGESGMVVIPGDPDNSILLDEVTSFSMPPYGSGYDFLSENQVNLISDWINENISS